MKRFYAFLFVLLFVLPIFASQTWVVGEVFTQSWCGYCPAARSGLHQLADNEAQAPYFIPLIWQGDTEYQSPNYSGRGNLYGVGGIPHSQWQGSLDDVGGGDTYPRYLSHYQDIVQNDSPATIDLNLHVNNSDQFVITADVELTGDISTTNNKICYILTYDFTGVEDPDYFASVTNYEDEDFTLTSTGETGTYTTTFPVDSSWELPKVKAVVLIQTFDGDHYIHQAATCFNSPPVNPVSPLELYFGQVEVGNSETLPITITNNHEDMTLSGDIYGINNFEMPPNYEVPPLESIQMDVTFTPPGANNYSGDVIITCNDPNFQVISLHVNGTGVNTANDNEIVPTKATLLGNYPNPFNPETKIEFQINDQTDAQIVIYNLKGEKIRTFSNLEGKSEIVWNGTDQKGNKTASGIYLYKIVGSDNAPRKMILLK